MISRYEAWIDGQALSGVNPNLLILDIQHTPADISYDTGILARRAGSVVFDEHQEGSSVTILFALRLYSIAERQAACQEVQRWAKGTILETNDRPGQRLYVRCTMLPKIESALDWTGTIEMTFTAFEKAYWEEITPSTLSLTAGTSGSGSLYVPGNAGDTVVEITATPSSTMNTFSITVGDTTISFTSLGATESNPLKITYDKKLIQSIKTGTTSKMGKRTAASADDLLAVCGANNSVSFTASVSTAVTVSARGLWL